MDLFDLTPTTDEIVVKLKHPSTNEVLLNDDESPMTITLWAPHTKQYKAVVYNQANKRIKMKQEDFTAEMLEESTLGLLAGATKSWDVTFQGKKPKLTEAKAKEVYDKVFWVKDQLQAEIESFEAFTPA